MYIILCFINFVVENALFNLSDERDTIITNLQAENLKGIRKFKQDITERDITIASLNATSLTTKVKMEAMETKSLLAAGREKNLVGA